MKMNLIGEGLVFCTIFLHLKMSFATAFSLSDLFGEWWSAGEEEGGGGEGLPNLQNSELLFANQTQF